MRRCGVLVTLQERRLGETVQDVALAQHGSLFARPLEALAQGSLRFGGVSRLQLHFAKVVQRLHVFHLVAASQGALEGFPQGVARPRELAALATGRREVHEREREEPFETSVS